MFREGASADAHFSHGPDPVPFGWDCNFFSLGYANFRIQRTLPYIDIYIYIYTSDPISAITLVFVAGGADGHLLRTVASHVVWFPDLLSIAACRLLSAMSTMCSECVHAVL